MAELFRIMSVDPAGGGAIGLCRMPGRDGRLAQDAAAIVRWTPRVVVTLTGGAELAAYGAGLPALLAESGIAHRHFPIEDYGVPTAADAAWPALSADLHAVLDNAGRVLVHCMGGCGRSGMIALRLMVERGEEADAALARLRAVRRCAVETEAQMAWAVSPSSQGRWNRLQNQPAVRPK